MVRQRAIAVDNQFVGGLKTEYTGLNFPDNACIETFDCVFDKSGLVSRRKGIDFEENYLANAISRSNKAITTYWWRNASGNGLSSLLVQQTGSTLYFYKTHQVTEANPLSRQKIVSTVNLTSFQTTTFDVTKECEYTDGNGYLFVFHPNMNPIYCSYNSNTDSISATAIEVKIRDLTGLPEATEVTLRPGTLTNIHHYNLKNQGWYGNTWTSTSESLLEVGLGSKTFVLTAENDIAREGDVVTATVNNGGSPVTMVGAVTSITPTTITINVTSFNPAIEEGNNHGGASDPWTLTSTQDFITIWHNEVGNYPSNADVWWYFKNADDDFAPGTQQSKVTLTAGPAPKGFYILDAFNQDRSSISGIAGLSTTTTNGIRPSTGAWFQSRLWFSGVNAEGFNEKLFFSQIIETEDQFGKCYQTNDPTSEQRFDLLPSDGGYISIQGAGKIHKLFPVANGMLVFADKGIWMITGSSGLGFTATDFTVTPISAIETLSSSSFVNVLGLPMWWNQEGIYTITAGSSGSFTVASLTNNSIAKFYASIPLESKYYAKGMYNPITFKVQWLYRDTEESGISDRYNYTNILNFDTQISAFYPWNIDTTLATINSINIIGGAGVSETIPFTFKYLTSVGDSFTFSDERDTNYVDFASLDGTGSVSYESYLISGFRVYGQGNRRFQFPYLDVYTEDETSELFFQTLWDSTSSGDTGKWSSKQHVILSDPDRRYQSKRLKVRGSGRVVQLKFSSVEGKPMSIIGWATIVENNQIP